MSKALEGEHLCVKHQGNYSHYAEHNCTVCKLQSELSALRKELEEAKKRDAEFSELASSAIYEILDDPYLSGHGYANRCEEALRELTFNRGKK
jgi:hypothetical protein